MENVDSPSPDLTPAGDTFSGEPGIQRVVDELLEFQSEVCRLLESERARADDAQKRLSIAQSKLDQLSGVLESARDDVERVRDSFRDYLKDTEDAQRALVAVTRHVLGVKPLTDQDLEWENANSPVDQDVKMAGSAEGNLIGTVSIDVNPETPIDATQDADTSQVEDSGPFESWEESSRPPNGAEEQIDPQTSADLRLIEFQNQMDMKRLDSVRRLAPLGSARRRRSS